MSEIYDTLLISRTSCEILLQHFPIEGRTGLKECITSLGHLSKLVSDTRFMPSEALNGPASVAKHNEDHGRRRMQKIYSSARRYVEEISDVCKPAVPERARKLLDRPNMHRLIEFYETTLPAFGNVRLIEELILERAHQEAKKGIMSSNFQNPQLQAMTNVRANDWINRLGYETGAVTPEGGGWSESTMRSVFRLLGDARWDRDVYEEDTTELKDAFKEPLLNVMKERCELMNAHMHSRRTWVASNTSCSTVVSITACLPDHMKSPFLSEYGIVQGRHGGSLKLIQTIRFVSTDERKSTIRTLRRLRGGDVIETRLRRPGGILDLASSFVAVLCFAVDQQDYMFGVKLSRASGSQYMLNTSEVVFAPLTYAVPAFTTHLCSPTESCITTSDNGKVRARTCPLIFSGTRFVVLGGADGYPARSA